MAIYHQFVTRHRALACSVLAGTSLFMGNAAQAQSSQQVNALEEVTVTARRRAESAQSVPVAVSAVGTEEIYRKNINDIDDLNGTVAGVNFTKSGAANNTVFSIRGRSRGVFGNALPAVNAYVNEVPLNTQGANIPTYDMASVQVLKGPQGTLFGRNSTSGAVLISTQTPEHEFGGYVTAKVGEYDGRVLEGAVTIPVVQDMVALRIAAQVEDRDGYSEDLTFTNLEDYGNRDRENFRVSLLVEPSESLSNLFVYESNDIDERPEAIVPVGFRPGAGAIPFVPYYSGGAFRAPNTLFPGDPGAGFIINPAATGPADALLPCNGLPSCDIAALVALQTADGNRAVRNDLPGFSRSEFDSFSNTTTWDAGPFTVKNILGYRELSIHTFTDIDGTQFPMVHADNVTGNKQFTNELQISGEAMDGALEYIGGLFYLKSEPDGGNRLALQLFAQSGTPITSTGPAPFNGAQGPGDFYTDTSKAAFGQVAYHLTDALSVDFGLRHTKDNAENCPVPGTSITLAPPTESACTQRIGVEFSKTTYNLSLNYQMTDDVLLYATSRSGYRAGGVNSPNFGGQLIPFQSYEPEEVQDIELGMKSDWTLGDIAGRLNVALYQSDYEGVHFAIPTSGLASVLPNGVDDDGDPTNDPSGGLFTGNAGDAEVQGIEVDLTVQLAEGLQVSFGGAYMDRELDVTLQLPASVQPFADQLATQEDIEAFVFLGAPDWSYSVSADYTLPLDSDIGEIAVGVRYYTMSDVHYGGNVFADEYSTTDVRLDWLNLMGSNFDAAFYVTNATDEEVIVAPASSGANIGINSAIFNEPRMWGASLRYSF